jgi:hypothetical protein
LKGNEVVRIVSGKDDAVEDANGQVSVSRPDLELVYLESNQIVGLRFTGIDIPQGATIVEAFIQFTASDQSSNNDAPLVIQAEATDDSPAIRPLEYNLSSRPKTAASVSWQPGPWLQSGAAEENQRTTDISPILQELFDRPGWAPGNAITLVITGRGKRLAKAFDGEGTAAPLLHVAFDNRGTINHFSAHPQTSKPGEPITFSWSASDATSASLSCTLDVTGDGKADYAFERCDEPLSQEHSYPIAGRYTALLEASNRNGGLKRMAVTTTVTTPSSVVIGAAGDIACDPELPKHDGAEGAAEACHMKQTSDLLLDLGVDAVLALGDNQYGGRWFWEWQESYGSTWGRLKDITYPIPGNHEYGMAGAKRYFEYFGEAAGDSSKGYYSFDLGDWHLIALISNCSQVGGCWAGSPQEVWLREDLAVHTNRCTLAFWHHPRYSSGDHGSHPFLSPLWQALYEHGAELVLSSHDHSYERFAPQDPGGNEDLHRGIRQFVVGTGGKDHRPFTETQANSEVRHSGTFGILQLRLHPESYDWRFVPEAGAAFTDSGNGVCH